MNAYHQRRQRRIISRLCVALGSLVLLLTGPGSVASTVSSAPSSSESPMQQGGQSFQRGSFEQAVLKWKDAALVYEREGKIVEQGQALMQLSQAYQALGQHRKALESLELALALARQSDDRRQFALIMAQLGQVYLSSGQLEAASQMLHEALGLANGLGNAGLSAVILNDLGILLASQQQYADALKTYEESLSLAETVRNRPLAVRARINMAKATLQLGRYQDAKDWLDLVVSQLQELDESHDKAYALINIGMGYQDLRGHLGKLDEVLLLESAKLFREATNVAQHLGDPRAASYAWGYLGRLYEAERRYQEALPLTNRAVFSAQLANAPESLYRWQWQTGRLLTALGQLDDAISAYSLAVETLQPIRQEVALGSEGLHSSFRETIRPLYFELADLLLQRAALTEGQQYSEPYLLRAREVVELLKAAELRDYFRDECVDALQGHIEKLDLLSKTTAVLYPILFADRTELLVSLPNGMARVTVPVTAERLTQEVRAFRRLLEKRTTREYLPHAQQLYNWLIRPLEPSLAAFPIDTLVVVPDGSLRTIPLSALHDGKQFLISKYAVATTPGLNLTDPRPLRRTRLKVLSAGLTEGVQGFPPLPNVALELRALEALYGRRPLLNQAFLSSSLEKEMREQPFTIVHIATHGKFESHVEDTFLLTFDDKLTMNRLSQVVGFFRFRDEPLELLTLSACETAVGDDRAALGLAGVAIKAGARSALATLWFINDEASSRLVVEFYQQLQKDPSASKAVALQRAQVTLIQDLAYRHPGYWAPFLLLNNWL